MVTTIAVGFFVGGLVGLTGIGGGTLMTPLLIFLLKMRPTLAIGTDILFAAITKGIGVTAHFRQGNVDTRLASTLALGSVPASIIGVTVATRLEAAYGPDFETVIQQVLGAALAFVALTILGRSFVPEHIKAKLIAQIEATMAPRRTLYGILVGAVVGFIVGLTSVGAGALITVLLMTFFRLSPAKVVGTDLFHAVILSVAAGSAQTMAGNVDFRLLALLLIGSLPGVYLGSLLSNKVPTRLLKPILAVCLLSAAAKLI